MNIVRYNDKRMRVNIDPFDIIEEAFVISGEFLSDKKESHKKFYIYIYIQLNFNDRSKFLLIRFSSFRYAENSSIHGQFFRCWNFN